MIEAHEELTHVRGLLIRDVRWLIRNCPVGRGRCSTVDEHFLQGIDPEAPILVRRTHVERAQGVDGTPVPVIVVLAYFKPLFDERWLLNEFACHIADYQLAVKQIAMPGPDRLERAKRREREEELAALHGDWSPWEIVETQWARLLAPEEFEDEE